MDFDDLDAAGGCRLYHMVVYGATGMTGCLIAEHIDHLCQKEVEEKGEQTTKWAIAGRSPDKLKKMKKNMKSEVAIVEVREGEDRKEDLEMLCDMSSVCINASGPYIVAGKDVVAACVEKGCHYVDVTGELIYNRRMIDFYGKKAKEKGVQIVIMCGMMCAVGDFSAYFAASKFGPMKMYREYYMSTAAARGGGSFFSGYSQYEHMNISEPPLLNDPFALYGERKCGKRKEDKDTTDAERDLLFPNMWVSPSFVGHPGMRIIRRTCHLFEQCSCGGPQYGESVIVASFDAFSNEEPCKQNAVMCRQPEDVRKIMKNAEVMQGGIKRGQGGEIGKGAPRDTRKFSRCEQYAAVESEDGRKGYVHFKGPEGYEVTAMFAVAAAFTWVEEPDQVNAAERGGVVTPAYAFHGTNYFERVCSWTFACREGEKISWEVVESELTEEVIMGTLCANEAHSGWFMGMLHSGEITGSEVPELLSGK